MVRLDLAFILCCCRACLGGSKSDDENYYNLLGVESDATLDEIKRAYKRKSLDLHPDKLAQRGRVVTKEDQARFTKMKEAYEVLSDPHKRETYDAIGAKGMKWIEEPFSIDPQEMANNFANSSTLDRSKIFAIFLGIAIAVFILPVLVCLQVDGVFGYYSTWAAVATPLWIFDALMLLYHVRIIAMGPLQRPDHIPEEEWFDPLPMKQRYIGLGKFLLYFLFQILAVLNLDSVIELKWSIVFIPWFVIEITTAVKRFTQANTEVVTMEELEEIFGQAYSELSEMEREDVDNTYSVFPSKNSEAYLIAKAIQESAKTEIVRIAFRSVFIVLLLLRIDGGIESSWWVIFAPFFAMSVYMCFGRCKKYTEVQTRAAEKLETTPEGATDYGAMEEGSNIDAHKQEPLSDEEQDEIKAELFRESSKAFTTCCSQTVFIVLLCLCLSKIQGAGFSSLWIISPFLFVAGVILCLLGCTIFCVTPVDEEEINAAYQRMSQGNTSVVVPVTDPEQPINFSTVADVSNAMAPSDEVSKNLSDISQMQNIERNVQPSPLQVVDLLDDPSVEKIESVDKGGLGPTDSEVNDLD